MLIAGAGGGLNALGENVTCVVGAIVLGEALRVHLVAGNVVGVRIEQRAEVCFSGVEISGIAALQGQTIKSKSVLRILASSSSSFWRRVFFCSVMVTYYTW